MVRPNVVTLEEQAAARQKIQEIEARVSALRSLNEGLLRKIEAETQIGRATVALNEDRIQQDERQIEMLKRMLPETHSALQLV